MLKKSLLIALILGIQGCVGTVRLAQDAGVENKSPTEPTVTKKEKIDTKTKE